MAKAKQSELPPEPIEEAIVTDEVAVSDNVTITAVVPQPALAVVDSTSRQMATIMRYMSVQEVEKVSHVAFVSRTFAGVQSEEQIFMKIMAGQELGITPVAIINGLYILNGTIGMRASVAGALLKRAGYSWDIVYDDVDNPQVCEITFYHRTLPHPYVSRFTHADAVRAKLVKTEGAHEKIPERYAIQPRFHGRC